MSDLSINAKNCDMTYLNMSKALRIFVNKYDLKFEEVDKKEKMSQSEALAEMLKK